MSRKILSITFYVLLAVFYALSCLQTTMCMPLVKRVMGAVPWLIWLLVGFATFAAGLEFFRSTKALQDKGVFALKLAMIALCTAVTLHHTAFFPLSALILFAVSAHLGEEDKLLKTGFYLGLAIVAVMFFLSMLGIVQNNRGNAFGFLYRTDYAAYLFALALLWCIIKDGFLTWLGELALIALAVYMGVAVGGRTDFICIVALILLTQCRHLRNAGSVPYQEGYGVVIPVVFRILYLPARGMCYLAKRLNPGKLSGMLRYSFIAASVFSFLLTLTYRPLHGFWAWLPGLDTIKSRLYYGTLGLEEYPVTLLGNKIHEIGNALRESILPGYFFLDNTYVRLLQVHGILMLVAFVALMTLVLWRLHKQKRYYAVVALSILAVGSIVEHFCIGLSYNLFALLTCCVLSKKCGVEVCSALQVGRLPVRRRVAVAALAAALCLLFGAWCSTAYRITSWRGRMPIYNATLVVPASDGDMDMQIGRLVCAKDYMLADSYAACIVSSEDEKKMLLYYGIAPSRIYVLDYSNADEMLTGAKALIESEGLQERLTICAYALEQGAIKHRADKMGLPLNSLEATLPKSSYLKLFVRQQWKMLWGKE